MTYLKDIYKKKTLEIFLHVFVCMFVILILNNINFQMTNFEFLFSFISYESWWRQIYDCLLYRVIILINIRMKKQN